MTQTGQSASETGLTTGGGGGGDFGNVKSKDIQYVNEELPDSMMKAIRIIERLLTQSKYHHEHVLYKNYPPVELKKGEEEEEENENDKGGFMAFGGGDKKKKEETKKEDETEKQEEDENDVTLTHLFKFKCDVTDGLPVSCIDINSKNPDLIAVSYGEFDIDCTKTLKQGILAFWTLKNPTFPEKIIYHDHSITCC